MSHMVIYRGVDGKPGYHQTDDIHDAVNFVEQMRNDEGVEHARIFRLEEVVFEYRPYYRVELTDAGSSPAELPENGAAGLPESTDSGSSAQVGSGSESGFESASDDDQTDDDALEVVEAADGNGDGNGEVKAEVGGAKKGLFGR